MCVGAVTRMLVVLVLTSGDSSGAAQSLAHNHFASVVEGDDEARDGALCERNIS